MRISHLLLASTLLCSHLARGDPWQYELLLMPSAQAVGTFDRQAPVTEIVDEVVQIDTLFTVQRGPFKLFGEFLLSDHEGDLERFQLGWQATQDTVVWIGRYHQPTSVWNHDHHHGQYLQTSITRPFVDEWEDLGGILPQHFTGMLIESGHKAFGSWRLRTAVAGGLAPIITPQGLEPFDLLHPDSRHHQVGFQGSVSLHPGELTESGFGLLAATDELPAIGLTAPPLPGLDHADLKLLGAFGIYAAAEWKILATWYHARANLCSPVSSTGENFGVGYVEAERRLPHDLTGFLRWESSADAGESIYLKLFPMFVRQRNVLGLRWDFVSHQALTLQLSDTNTLDGHFSDIRLQWSAAFL
ncbi:MAG TPA: hypothetical protein VNY25_07675 [Steroidobacteraceae bacterium]|nr:hypothetical protein [Steroidobacteraceae bacterium]